MGLHRVTAVEPRPGAGPAADGFVVLQTRIAESEVVHGALGGGKHPQRTVQRIHDALRGLDVTGGDRGGRPRIEHRAGRDHDLKRLRQPSLSGIGPRSRVRNTYSTAAMHTARGALKLCSPWGEVP